MCILPACLLRCQVWHKHQHAASITSPPRHWHSCRKLPVYFQIAIISNMSDDYATGRRRTTYSGATTDASQSRELTGLFFYLRSDRIYIFSILYLISFRIYPFSDRLYTISDRLKTFSLRLYPFSTILCPNIHNYAWLNPIQARWMRCWICKSANLTQFQSTL